MQKQTRQEEQCKTQKQNKFVIAGAIGAVAVIFVVSGIAASSNNVGAEEKGIEIGSTFVPQVTDLVNRSKEDFDDNTS